jgi:hypothetical protein
MRFVNIDNKNAGVFQPLHFENVEKHKNIMRYAFYEKYFQLPAFFVSASNGNQ